MQNLYKNFNGFEKHEIVVAIWMSEACFGEPNLENLKKILYEDFDPTKEDYKKFKNFLESRRPACLSNEINKIICVQKVCIERYWSFFVSPYLPHQIALKIIHDEKEVNLYMIEEAIKKHGYASSQFPFFGILKILKMGERFKRKRKYKIQFVAYPEKMESVWDFLKYEGYTFPKKVINL